MKRILVILPCAEDPRETATDWYLIILLFVFPLFYGFTGYQNITEFKFAFLMAATGLWLAALGILSARMRREIGPFRAAEIAALVFIAVCFLSAALSPWPIDALVGAGRFDGLLTLACYVLIFLGVSRFTRPKLFHAGAFAAAVALCCAVGVLQLFGLDVLRLFPSGYSYYDTGIYYSGTYLGTIGNTNILDAVLCLALPLFSALYLLGAEHGPLFLLPLVPAVFVAVFSGGSGGAVAGAAALLCAMPLLLTDVSRLRRGLRCAAVVLFSAAAALAYVPDYTGRVLTPRFGFTPAVWVSAGMAAACLLASLPSWSGFEPSGTALRRCFLAIDALLIFGGLTAVWFWPGTQGTLYELREVLHGRLEDGYGSSRVLIWRRCLALVPERPLLGGGPGTLALRADIEFSRYVPETGTTLTAFVDNAHNIYLGYLVNCGALGLASYLGLLLCAVRNARRAWSRPLIPGVALGLFCAAVHGLFGLGLILSEPFFWALLGLLCSREETV